MRRPLVVRGCSWECRQQGWVGGSKEPLARRVGAGPRAVGWGCRLPWVDHQIVLAVLASPVAGCGGQRRARRALILQAMRERERGQVERWHTSRHQALTQPPVSAPEHFRIHRFRLWVRAAAVRGAAEAPPGSRLSRSA